MAHRVHLWLNLYRANLPPDCLVFSFCCRLSLPYLTTTRTITSQHPPKKKKKKTPPPPLVKGARGTVKRTEKGELSVAVDEFEMLTKSLLPLPDKFRGLQDVEMRRGRVRVRVCQFIFVHTFN